MSALNSLLKILSWFFNPERWKARRKEAAYNEIKKWERALATALMSNDAKAISLARAKLKELRDKSRA